MDEQFLYFVLCDSFVARGGLDLTLTEDTNKCSTYGWAAASCLGNCWSSVGWCLCAGVRVELYEVLR